MIGPCCRELSDTRRRATKALVRSRPTGSTSPPPTNFENISSAGFGNRQVRSGLTPAPAARREILAATTAAAAPASCDAPTPRAAGHTRRGGRRRPPSGAAPHTAATRAPAGAAAPCGGAQWRSAGLRRQAAPSAVGAAAAAAGSPPTSPEGIPHTRTATSGKMLLSDQEKRTWSREPLTAIIDSPRRPVQLCTTFRGPPRCIMERRPPPAF